MINFEISGVCHLLKGLVQIEQDLQLRSGAGQTFATGAVGSLLRMIKKLAKHPNIKLDVTGPEIKQAWEAFNAATRDLSQADFDHIKEWLRYAAYHAQAMELQAVLDRIGIFEAKLNSPTKLSFNDLVSEVRTLRETLETGLKSKYFYHYPQNKAALLRRMEGDWSGALRAFPSIANDVAAAVDCYALEHNTAAVFHSMRVVERGLREFAEAVNITFDVQQWHTIIVEIESQIREIGERWPKGGMKSEWMRFYSEAAKEFFYFKDGWRNYVSHGGDPYDEHQALSVLEHVRVFMNHLATRFGAPVSS